MKLFLLEYRNWDEYACYGIFSTRELAEARKKEIMEEYKDPYAINYSISVYELDEKVNR